MSCRVQWHSLPYHPSWVTQGGPSMWAQYTLLLWLSLGCWWQINGRDLHRPVTQLWDWLWPLTTHLHLLWRISCSGAGWRCSEVVYSCPLGVQAIGFPSWYRPRTATTCILSRDTLHELQNNLQMAVTCAGLEIPRQSQAVNLGWLLLVPTLGPRSMWYGGWGPAEAGCCLFERI